MLKTDEKEEYLKEYFLPESCEGWKAAEAFSGNGLLRANRTQTASRGDGEVTSLSMTMYDSTSTEWAAHAVKQGGTAGVLILQLLSRHTGLEFFYCSFPEF